MADNIGHVDARQLKAQLHDGGEIALLDAREEGVFHTHHLLLASCVPLGRLELLIDDLVPRRGVRVVWCDDGDGSALRAAKKKQNKEPRATATGSSLGHDVAGTAY